MTMSGRENMIMVLPTWALLVSYGCGLGCYEDEWRLHITSNRNFVDLNMPLGVSHIEHDQVLQDTLIRLKRGFSY